MFRFEYSESYGSTECVQLNLNRRSILTEDAEADNLKRKILCVDLEISSYWSKGVITTCVLAWSWKIKYYQITLITH